MKLFLVILCATLAVFASADEDVCVVDGHTYKVGASFSKPGACQWVTCDGPGSFFSKTCPSVAAPKTCKAIPQDNSKPYPECCPQFICD